MCAVESHPDQRLRKEFNYLLFMRGCGGKVDNKFAQQLINAIGDWHQKIIDIADSAMEWGWQRSDVTLRALLLQGGSELLGQLTKPEVALDEYIKLGKRFGEPYTGRIVNAVLDQHIRPLLSGSIKS